MWDSLRKVRWVDDLERIKTAQNKQRQLRVASEVGLVIPRTPIANNPEAVREFFQEVKGKMVTKLLTALSRSMEYTPFFLYTSAVKEEDLLDADSLRYCPMVFQEEIPKQLELRVVFVRGNVFVGALDASVYGASKVDWRQQYNYELRTTNYFPHVGLCRRCRASVKAPILLEAFGSNNYRLKLSINTQINRSEQAGAAVLGI